MKVSCAFSALFLLFSLFYSVVASAENLYLPYEKTHIDTTKHIILSNYPIDSLKLTTGIEIDSLIIKIDNDSSCKYKFNTAIQTHLSVGEQYNCKVNEADTEVYKLFFTNLPIGEIVINTPIVDEPRRPGVFYYSEPINIQDTTFLGVEYRGATSQRYPKKNLRVEFLADTVDFENAESVDKSFCGLRNDDDWNFQAMYIEPLRIRSKISFDLWRDIQRPMHYSADEPKAKNYVGMEYFELFINGQYWGLYAFGEKIDRKQLKLKK